MTDRIWMALCFRFRRYSEQQQRTELVPKHAVLSLAHLDITLHGPEHCTLKIKYLPPLNRSFGGLSMQLSVAIPVIDYCVGSIKAASHLISLYKLYCGRECRGDRWSQTELCQHYITSITRVHMRDHQFQRGEKYSICFHRTWNPKMLFANDQFPELSELAS